MPLFLLLYDIAVENDPHGIRVRLVRELRKSGALQVQRSVWVIESVTPSLLRVINELRAAGGVLKMSEWLPRTIKEATGKEPESKKVALAVIGREPFSLGLHDKVKSLLERGLGCSVKLVPVGESAVKEYGAITRSRVRGVDLVKAISKKLDEIALEDADAIVILNCGRSSKSGMMYIAQALARTTLLRNLTSLPMLQVERPWEPDSAIIVWNESAISIGRLMKGALKAPLIKPSLSLKKTTNIGYRELRQIHYARVGDSIIVEGLKVGVCLSEQVFIVAERGKIVDIIGGRMLKAAKKVKLDTLDKAVVKTVWVG
jgi:CRISPR/Cas system-associated endoribonuclease Cas2